MVDFALEAESRNGNVNWDDGRKKSQKGNVIMKILVFLLSQSAKNPPKPLTENIHSEILFPTTSLINCFTREKIYSK